MKGAFITLEGPEGSGKSTQARLLSERLAGSGKHLVVTREPGGTRTGEVIRHLLQHASSDADMGPASEVLLFCASRAQLVAQVIRPALERGDWVLCDRFTDSTLAYQGYGRGFALDELRRLNAFATGGLEPDLTVLLDVPCDEGFRRIGRRNENGETGADRIERADRAFHERLRVGYLQLAAAEPERFRVVPSRETPEETAEAVWLAVAERFRLTAPAGGRSGRATG